MELHIPAIRFPNDRVSYVGIDPPESITSQASLVKGEEEKGYGLWKGDLYGVGDVLSKKRMQRGWDGTTLKVVGHCLEDEIEELLKWKGGESGVEVYAGKVPWAEEPLVSRFD